MLILFFFIPLVFAIKYDLGRPPGMYPPEEMKDNVPTVPRNPYQTNMIDDGVMDYQFYYELDPKKEKHPQLSVKTVFPSSGVSSGPIPPPSYAPEKSAKPTYINESPRSPAPYIPTTPQSNPQNDSSKLSKPGFATTPGFSSSNTSHHDMHEYIGWKPVAVPIPASEKSDRNGRINGPSGNNAGNAQGNQPPWNVGKNSGNERGEDNRVGGPPEPPSISDKIKPPGLPRKEVSSSAVLAHQDPQTTSYEVLLAKSKPYLSTDLNTSGRSGGGMSPAAKPEFDPSNYGETGGKEEYTRNELGNYDGSQERRQDKHHLSVGKSAVDNHGTLTTASGGENGDLYEHGDEAGGKSASGGESKLGGGDGETPEGQSVGTFESRSGGSPKGGNGDPPDTKRGSTPENDSGSTSRGGVGGSGPYKSGEEAFRSFIKAGARGRGGDVNFEDPSKAGWDQTSMVRVPVNPQTMETQFEGQLSNPPNKYQGVIMKKTPTKSDDTDIPKKSKKCCPCCRHILEAVPPVGETRTQMGTEPFKSGISQNAGRADTYGQKREGPHSHLKQIYAEDLSDINKLGDRFESRTFQTPGAAAPLLIRTRASAAEVVHEDEPDDSSLRIASQGSDSPKTSSRSGGHPFIEDRSTEPTSGRIHSQSNTNTLKLQRSGPQLSTLSTAGGYNAPTGFFPEPQPLGNSGAFSPPASYASPFSSPSLGLGYSTPGVGYPPPSLGYSSSIGYPSVGGCPCAPPPPAPCCVPVQPCCMPTIPCCPPPPPVQCCPRPPVCCQPPPACCPPPVVCCSVPAIPTCLRACPACPCRRRVHRALRMKRSPGLGGHQCRQCTASGQPKYIVRVKRQSNCRDCSTSSNPLLSLFAPSSTSSSCSACRRSDTRAARVKRMGCLPCGKRKRRDIEEEYHRRVKRLGCMPCFGRKKRSPMPDNCRQCSNLGQVLRRFKRTIGCSPCGRKKREAKEASQPAPASCPCLRSQTHSFLLGRKKRAIGDDNFDSLDTCDKSCCDYDKCHEISATKVHASRHSSRMK